MSCLQCLACNDNRWHPVYNAKRHETSQSHLVKLGHWQRSTCWVTPNPLETNPRVNAFVNDSIVQLLGELQDRRPHSPPPIPSDYFDIEMDPPQSDFEFLQAQDPAHYTVSFDGSDTAQLQASAADMAIAQLAKELETFMFNDFGSESSEDEFEERDPSPECFAEALKTLEEMEQDPVSFGQQRTCMKPSHNNPEWFPWPDKAACILDLFRHLPRGIFSEAQMEIVTWALSAFGINNVPSVDEMANPHVRQHIHHYHEDSGRRLEHAWQAEAWRDLDPDLATPMKLDIDHGAQGYVVHEWDQVQFPVTSLLASLPHISESFDLDGGYDPRIIIGIQKQPNEELSPWTHTTRDTGSLNPWRIKAKNHRVLTFTMWVYCE
ncbi:hypothetical protein BT96DRAFT_1004526 [Gymnopus androsaceus JB14]|uniref:Uncharacterized protein n=1 Tax=Gymnopus androsaceus JB14 TaxID=1447944 RepID=A0A6A4GQM1_9AGAR|nr:hypothetical protein BT96DRAFT_1004526 [Gymnopus androsaceus JB14]